MLIFLVELLYNTAMFRTTVKTPLCLYEAQEAVLANDLSVGESEFMHDQEIFSCYYSFNSAQCAETNDPPIR